MLVYHELPHKIGDAGEALLLLLGRHVRTRQAVDVTRHPRRAAVFCGQVCAQELAFLPLVGV
jgi:hypothetical protein